jgi:hypothetical protein
MGLMFCPKVRNCFYCNLLTFPFGKRTKTSVFFIPRNQLAMALPVSPDVATNTCIFFVGISCRKYEVSFGYKSFIIACANVAVWFCPLCCNKFI